MLKKPFAKRRGNNMSQTLANKCNRCSLIIGKDFEAYTAHLEVCRHTRVKNYVPMDAGAKATIVGKAEDKFRKYLVNDDTVEIGVHQDVDEHGYPTVDCGLRPPEPPPEGVFALVEPESLVSEAKPIDVLREALKPQPVLQAVSTVKLSLNDFDKIVLAIDRTIEGLQLAERSWSNSR
jgi:hypothetical protein